MRRLAFGSTDLADLVHTWTNVLGWTQPIQRDSRHVPTDDTGAERIDARIMRFLTSTSCWAGALERGTLAHLPATVVRAAAVICFWHGFSVLSAMTSVWVRVFIFSLQHLPQQVAGIFFCAFFG